MPAEVKEPFELIKERIHAQGRSQRERDILAGKMRKAMYDLANDLTYPIDEEGNVMDVSFLIPMLSYHLAKCGYRKVEEEAVIKQVPVRNAQVEGAVTYVPIDSPGQVPPALKKQTLEKPIDMQAWHTKTHVTVNGDTVKGGK